MANDSVDLPSYSQIDDKRRSISRPAQSLYLHYKLFHSGIPLTVRECFDYEERGIGRIKRTDISPPYTMQFVKKTICEVEGFEMSDIKAVHMDGESEPTGDDVPVSFQLGSPGTSLDSPIAIVLEEAAKVADPAVQRGRYLAKAPHEDVLFQANGKFFAHIDGEWTEHQLGEFEILQNRITGHARLLVRHQHTQAFLTGQRSLDGWELSPSKSSERTWSWRELAEPDGSKYKKHRHWVSVRFEHKRGSLVLLSSFH
ncbi:hypothetical protein DL93DRAFT_2090558, partial [Clavulina sp. PMI_390]